MFRTRHSIKCLTAMAFVILYIFSYANANMFWHCHTVCGQNITHSHFHGKAHQTGQADGGHTCNGLVLISIADQTTTTEEAVPTIGLSPLRPFVECILAAPVLPLQTLSAPHASLRGPPAPDR